MRATENGHHRGSFAATWAAIRDIPSGAVASYADVAARVFGARRAARTVGWALAGCPADVPWWRVVHADGSLAGVRDELQAELLRGEGVGDVRACLGAQTSLNSASTTSSPAPPSLCAASPPVGGGLSPLASGGVLPELEA